MNSVSEQPVVEPGKPWFQSKTFAFNILAVVIGVAMLFGFGEHQSAEWVEEAVVVVAAAINMALRLWTKQAVT